MPLTAVGMRTVMRQLQEIEAHPIADIRVCPSDDLNELRFDLDGPEGTPFEAGRFHVVLQFDEHYPEVPPKGYFRTKIFHPNIAERGDICVNALKRDWKPDLGLRHILLVIRCLLVEPNPESALNEEAGRLQLEDYDAYGRKAAMFTTIHAKRPVGERRFPNPEDGQDKQRSGSGAVAGIGSDEPSDGPMHTGEDDAEALACAGASSSNGGANTALRSLQGNATAPSAADKAKKKVTEKKKAALKRI